VSWYCCRCRHENSQILMLTCIECGHGSCSCCDAGPKYFFSAALRKYSLQLSRAMDYIRESK
jgi:hypothetical protein